MSPYGTPVNGAMQHGSTFPFAVTYISVHGRLQSR